MKRVEANTHFKNNKVTINATIILLRFKEDNNYILYSPHLEIYGYGNTEEEATASFEICLGSFLDYSTKKNTFLKELKRLGWELIKGSIKKPKKITPPSWDTLFKKNHQLEDLLNKKEIKTSHKLISLPA